MDARRRAPHAIFGEDVSAVLVALPISRHGGGTSSKAGRRYPGQGKTQAKNLSADARERNRFKLKRLRFRFR